MLRIAQNWQRSPCDDSILCPFETLGSQISIDNDGCWKLFETNQIGVKASWIKHRMPTFGFVVEQKPSPGRLDVEGLKAKGITPGPLYAKIKAGHNVTMGDGTLVEASKFIGPPKPGKKMTLLGDCCDVSDHLIRLGRASDVLVHEATMEDELREKAIDYGHSTPSMAAEVANRMDCKLLILNHFSQRYTPLDKLAESETTKANKHDDNSANDDDEEETSVQKLIDQAQSICKCKVIGAYDFYAHKVE